MTVISTTTHLGGAPRRDDVGAGHEAADGVDAAQLVVQPLPPPLADQDAVADVRVEEDLVPVVLQSSVDRIGECRVGGRVAEEHVRHRVSFPNRRCLARYG